MTKQIASKVVGSDDRLTEPQVGSHNQKVGSAEPQEELNKQEQVKPKTRGIEMVKGAARYRSSRFQERRL